MELASLKCFNVCSEQLGHVLHLMHRVRDDSVCFSWCFFVKSTSHSPSTKLFIFGAAFQILHKALTKPAWAGFSAQLSRTARKLSTSMKIPVVLCIDVKWLAGFLLNVQLSLSAAIICDSQSPIIIWPRRSSSLHPVKIPPTGCYLPAL